MESISEALSKLPISPPSKSPSKFHLFTSLAPELRLKIWSYACFPRTVKLTYSPTTNTFQSTTPPPVLLSITTESRQVAKKNYLLSFSTSSSTPKIYFSPTQDTLYIPRCREMGYDDTLRDFKLLVGEKDRGMLEKVREVAIDHVDGSIKRPWEGYNKASFIRSFPSLEAVTLVLTPSIPRLMVSEGPGLFNEWATESEGSSRGRRDVVFKEPRVEAELLLRFWACFKRQFLMEEKALERVCESVGREYCKFTLPVVRLVERGEI